MLQKDGSNKLFKSWVVQRERWHATCNVCLEGEFGGQYIKFHSYKKVFEYLEH